MESTNMAETIVELLTDVADAIREKKGTTEPINAQNFADEIKNLPSGSGSGGWTGHADAEGLRAIGWDDEDIEYYQKYGVNWNEEDDQYHLVSDDNKALYGVLTANNISAYRDRIVYLPKIDTSAKTKMTEMFSGCKSLVAIPKLNTSNVTNMDTMFQNCYSLISIPQLDTSNVTTMSNMFRSCNSLVSIPLLDTSNVMIMSYMFQDCTSLISIPLLYTSDVRNIQNMLYNCHSLVSIPALNTSNVTNITYMLRYCYSLVFAGIKELALDLDLSSSPLLDKNSLLYIINNEAATSPITIKLAQYAHDRLAKNKDIQAALAAHTNITLGV